MTSQARKHRRAAERAATAVPPPAAPPIPRAEEQNTILEWLRLAFGQVTPGVWQKGDSTHNLVSRTMPGRHRCGFSKDSYDVAHFHHGSDAWSVSQVMRHGWLLMALANAVIKDDLLEIVAARDALLAVVSEFPGARE